MKNILIFVLSLGLFVFISQSSYSQFLVEIKKKEFKTSDSGFDKAWDDLQIGDELFSAGRGTYKDALKYYLSAHEYNALNPQLNYRIGVCYLFSDNKSRSLDFLKASYEFNKHVAPDIHYMLARAYHINYRFDNAISEYRTFLNSLNKQGARLIDTVKVSNYIDQCRTGLEIMKDTLRVEVINLGTGINSADDDYKPVFSSSYDRMYFTTRRGRDGTDKRNERDNKFNEKIYISYSTNDSLWGLAQNIGEPVNTKKNSAALLLTDDDETLYIYHGDEDGGVVFYSYYIDGSWIKPKKFKSKLNSGYHESSVSVTADRQNLYFISSRLKGSQGGLDVWLSKKDEKGKWQDPVNLGPPVNSPYNEEAIFLADDEKTMFFSSDRPSSMGGYDVFKTSLGEDGNWSEPVNLGYPINSSDDDLFYVVLDSLTAFISSIREEDNVGLMDIYRLQYLPEPLPEPVDTTPEIIEPPVEVIVPLVVIPKPDPTVKIYGRVQDASDSTALQGMVEIIDMEENKIVATTISSREDGSYSLKLKRKDSYGVEVNSSGYMFYLDIMQITADTSVREIQRDFTLNKIKVGEKIVLENIFFEFNKSTLSPESFTELDRAADFMDNNPELRIEISGHTDNVGSADYNQRLSESRAKAVVEYMVSKGIDNSRMEYAGYGFEQPITTNDTEEGRATNRRVEFKVIE